MNAKSTYEESELIILLRQKDEHAFGYLYDNYGTALYDIVRQIIGNRETSSDVLQDVFVMIWRKIDTYDPLKGRLFTWMVKIARNVAIDNTRSKDYKKNVKQVAIDNIELSQPSITSGYDDYGLKKVIGKLKKEERLLIDLSYYQGFTHDQIAKALDMPLGTVKTRIRSALIQLRTILK